MTFVLTATLTLFATVASLDPQVLFMKGDFPAAAAAAQATLARTPGDPAALLVAGTIAVYENRLADASKYLTAIPQSEPVAPIMQRLSAEIDRRTTLARHGDITYGPDTDAVPFVTTDPIPVIALIVNGHRGLFQIDTGAPGISVDRAFAAEIGLPASTTSHVGLFANGVPQMVPETTIASVRLGGATIANLSATVLPLRDMNRDAYTDHLRIDGAIGTGIFERFAAVTIDYARGTLVLYAPGSNLAAIEGTMVPLWLVGDHFLVTRGEVAGQPGAVAIDTGLLGAGVVPSEQTVSAAHLRLGPSGMGQTPGGPARVSSLIVPEVRIGDVVEHDVRGLDAPAASQHSPFRFEIVGTIGHEFFERRALTIDFTHMRLIVS